MEEKSEKRRYNNNKPERKCIKWKSKIWYNIITNSTVFTPTNA
jgi:hypothetical protein